MITISLCMIVKNEEDTLERCLSSVEKAVDEIIIIDTGSTDNTKIVAERFTDKVYDFLWQDDFAKARNFSFEFAACDYILWLDADDVIEGENLSKLLELKETLDPAADIVMMKYNVSFDQNQNPVFSYYRERLIKNHKGYLWQGAVHEVITPIGKVLYSEIAVSHRKIRANEKGRNLRIYEKLLADSETLDLRQQFYYGRELYYNRNYEKAVKVIEDFLNSKQGWIENNISACEILAFCYYKLKQEDKALTALLKSFLFDIPRAEICCDIGKHFLDRECYHQSVFWFEQALQKKREDYSGGFIQEDCYGYIPCLQLCVCYDKLGDIAKAELYNEKAEEYKPNDGAVLYNRAYFAQCKENKK